MFHYATHASHCFLLDLPLGNGTDKLSQSHTSPCEYLLVVNCVNYFSAICSRIFSWEPPVLSCHFIPRATSRGTCKCKGQEGKRQRAVDGGGRRGGVGKGEEGWGEGRAEGRRRRRRSHVRTDVAAVSKTSEIVGHRHSMLA